jgi:hypothetical protein
MNKNRQKVVPDDGNDAQPAQNEQMQDLLNPSLWENQSRTGPTSFKFVGGKVKEMGNPLDQGPSKGTEKRKTMSIGQRFTLHRSSFPTPRKQPMLSSLVEPDSREASQESYESKIDSKQEFRVREDSDTDRRENRGPRRSHRKSRRSRRHHVMNQDHVVNNSGEHQEEKFESTTKEHNTHHHKSHHHHHGKRSKKDKLPRLCDTGVFAEAPAGTGPRVKYISSRDQSSVFAVRHTIKHAGFAVIAASRMVSGR